MPSTPPTTVMLAVTAGAADVVRFRDDADTTWHDARAVSATQYAFDVTGPYWLSVGCHVPQPNPAGQQPAAAVWQVARTLDEGVTIERAFCDVQARVTPAGEVDTTMVQPGVVTLGDALTRSTTANWNVQLTGTPGTYALYATGDHRLAIRRGVELTDPKGAAPATLPAIDLATEGTLLTPTAFTISNAAPGTGVTLQAAIAIEASGAADDLVNYVYLGDPAAAEVIPTAMLTAADLQTVSLRRNQKLSAAHTASQAYRRPFKLGDSTVFTVPDPITGLAWTVDTTQLAVTWSSTPADLPLELTLDGEATNLDGRSFDIDLSAAFLKATGATHAAADSAVPGFSSSWAIDPAMGYQRSAIAQLAPDRSTQPVITATDYDSVDPK